MATGLFSVPAPLLRFGVQRGFFVGIRSYDNHVSCQPDSGHLVEKRSAAQGVRLVFLYNSMRIRARLKY